MIAFILFALLVAGIGWVFVSVACLPSAEARELRRLQAIRAYLDFLRARVS